MLAALSDEDFNGRIIRGLMRAVGDLNLLELREIDLLGASDAEVLAAAAELKRVVITHDAKTMPKAAYERVQKSLPMPGLVVCPQSVDVGTAVAELTLLLTLAENDWFDNAVVYLPL
jgi:predicted nuclease of predicted toxin-antitoxin system